MVYAYSSFPRPSFLPPRRPPPLPHLRRCSQNHPKQWAEFNQLPIPGLHDTKIFYGATCQTDLPNQRFEYMCAFEVPTLSIGPPDGRMIVPAAHYAVFTHPDGTATLHDPWQYIWKQWLPVSGLKPAPTPDFERYDERFSPTTGKGTIEIWFPIQHAPGL